MKFLSTCFFIILIPASSGVFAETASTSPGYVASLESGAESGNEKMQMKLAGMFLQGNGVTADIDKALYYYRLAAKQNIAFAHYRLARLYLDGNYVATNQDQALAWFLSAARLGFVQAQLDLSLLYETGFAETPADFIQAYKWLSIASSLTEDDLIPARQKLEAKMTFIELAQAKFLSSICILTGYQDC